MEILKLLIIHKYRYICSMYLFFRFLAFCIRYCRCTKIPWKPYIAMVRSLACLLCRFSSLSFGLQITLRCIHTVFQSSTIYIRHNHVCFFIRISEIQQLFSHPLPPSIYLWLELFFFIHLSLFRALFEFFRKN